MATALYDNGRAGLLGVIDWLADNIKCVLVDTGAYTPNLATDTFLSDIPVGARISTSGNLTGKLATGGVASATDITFAAVTGATCEALVIYKDTGVVGTSQLIAFLDNLLGLPYSPNGSNAVIVWNVGVNKIFKL